MKVNELRIGNLLHSKLTNMDFRVTAIDIVNISEEPDNVEPIPLTVDWFKKCGAIEDEYGDLFVSCPIGIDMRFYLNDGFIQLCKYYCAPLINFEHAKYVHLFQNLYIPLSEKELEIKL